MYCTYIKDFCRNQLLKGAIIHSDNVANTFFDMNQEPPGTVLCPPLIVLCRNSEFGETCPNPDCCETHTRLMSIFVPDISIEEMRFQYYQRSGLIPSVNELYMDNDTSNHSVTGLFMDKTTADVHFICSSDKTQEHIPAHKAILALHSPAFKKMFFGDLIETGDVHIEGATADGFKEYLQFFYLEKVKLTIENVPQVVYLAKKYDTGSLLKTCCMFLKHTVTLDQICVVLELATKFDMIDLMSFCEWKIVAEGKRFFASEEFINCKASVLKKILELDEPKYYTEDILMGCLQWAKHSWKHKNGSEDEPSLVDIRNELGDMFSLIQFGSMDSASIIRIMNEKADLFTKEDLIAIMQIAKYSTGESEVQCTFLTCKETTRLIDKVEVTTVQSNNRILLVAYETTGVYPENPMLPQTITVVKKLTNSKDVVLLREKRYLCENGNHKLAETILIEANTKYEIRVKFMDINKDSVADTTVIGSKEFQIMDKVEVLIEGSGVITSLTFKSLSRTIRNSEMVFDTVCK